MYAVCPKQYALIMKLLGWNRKLQNYLHFSSIHSRRQVGITKHIKWQSSQGDKGTLRTQCNAERDENPLETWLSQLGFKVSLF